VAHYVGVFMPLAAGGWRGLIPDVPECEATGASLDLAVSHAASALIEHAGTPIGTRIDNHRAPRDLTAIRGDEAWASDNAIDWSTAVVTMLRMPQ